MPQGQKKKSAVRGFTLIELLVASTIFIVVSMVVVSIFLMAIKNQRRGFQVQNLQDNARYIIETMAKEIRMSPSDIEKPSNTGETAILEIINQDNVNRVRYLFENEGGTSNCITDCITRIEKNKGSAIGGGQKGEPLNSSQVNVSGKFYVVKESGKQQTVTIVMTFSPAGANEPKITVQNTIAVRKY